MLYLNCTFGSFARCRPSDETVASVASNNSACLRGTKDMFESLKRIRTAVAESVRGKLNKAQVLTLLANRCVLLLHMGKVCMSTPAVVVGVHV